MLTINIFSLARPLIINFGGGTTAAPLILMKTFRLNMSTEEIHNKLAPYWATAFVVLAGTGLSSIWFNPGSFYSGYVLDMTGPAWNYILFRGLYTGYSQNAWIRFFSPVRTVIIFVLVCYGIEITQYLKLYDSTYDPFDFLAYVSILVPIFIIDFYFSSNRNQLKSKN